MLFAFALLIHRLHRGISLPTVTADVAGIANVFPFTHGRGDPRTVQGAAGTASSFGSTSILKRSEWKSLTIPSDHDVSCEYLENLLQFFGNHSLAIAECRGMRLPQERRSVSLLPVYLPS